MKIKVILLTIFLIFLLSNTLESHDPTMKLSKNFTLRELTRSQTALRKGIHNEPNEEHLIALTVLVHKVLQPIRDKFGTVSCNSGYRCAELCELLGSSAKSSHCKGEAVDCEAYSISNRELAQWIKDNLEFDQVILEYPGKDPRDGWVHVSYRRDGENRNEVLTAIREEGKTVYKKGLQ